LIDLLMQIIEFKRQIKGSIESKLILIRRYFTLNDKGKKGNTCNKLLKF